MVTLLLLPGMDGSGELFAPFVDSLPADVQAVVVRLPALGSYAELQNAVEEIVPREGEFAILAESFSGPLAIELARRHADRVRALVLCNTFIASPRPWLRFVPWRVAFLLGAPRFVLRDLFGAPKELVCEVQRVARECGGACLAARLESVLELRPVSVAGIECPVLYLRGTRDRLVPKSSVAAVVKAIPNVIVREIDAPHLLLQARPREAWTAMRDVVTPSSSVRTSLCPR